MPSIAPYAIGADSQAIDSREIADLCEKRHDNVMRDIRDILSQLYGEGTAPKFGGSYLGQDRTTRPCFNLPKRETLILQRQKARRSKPRWHVT